MGTIYYLGIIYEHHTVKDVIKPGVGQLTPRSPGE